MRSTDALHTLMVSVLKGEASKLEVDQLNRLIHSDAEVSSLFSELAETWELSQEVNSATSPIGSPSTLTSQEKVWLKQQLSIAKPSFRPGHKSRLVVLKWVSTAAVVLFVTVLGIRSVRENMRLNSGLDLPPSVFVSQIESLPPAQKISTIRSHVTPTATREQKELLLYLIRHDPSVNVRISSIQVFMESAPNKEDVQAFVESILLQESVATQMLMVDYMARGSRPSYLTLLKSIDRATGLFPEVSRRIDFHVSQP